MAIAPINQNGINLLPTTTSTTNVTSTYPSVYSFSLQPGVEVYSITNPYQNQSVYNNNKNGYIQSQPRLQSEHTPMPFISQPVFGANGILGGSGHQQQPQPPPPPYSSVNNNTFGYNNYDKLW